MKKNLAKMGIQFNFFNEKKKVTCLNKNNRVGPSVACNACQTIDDGLYTSTKNTNIFLKRVPREILNN